MGSPKVMAQCRQWMTRPELIELGSIDLDGYPQIRSMANMRCKALYPQLKDFFEEEPPFRTYLTTHGRSEKVRQLRRNGQVSVYFISPQSFQSLLLVGEIRKVSDKRIKEMLWQPDWTQSYPDGPLVPSFSVFVLDPHIAKGWNETRPFNFKIDLPPGV